MRKIQYLLLISALNCYVNLCPAQTKPETGIRFFQGTWSSLLKEAAKQHKLIFVDVYTTWCGPCKRMEKEIFPLAEVGKVYDSLFVSYRLDAEHNEGPKLSSTYAIKAYPTYLFLDSTGNLLYRSGDYMKASDLIAEARKATSKKPIGESLAQLENRFKSGDRHPALLRALLNKRTSLGMDNAEVLNAYVKTMPPENLRSPETIIYLSEHLGSTISTALPVVLQGLKELDNEQQKQLSNRVYNGLLYYALGNAIKEKQLTRAGELVADVNKIRHWLSEQWLSSADNLELHYDQAAKDTAGLKRTGYRIAAKQISIPIDSIKKRDSAMFVKIMQPFLTGKQDSTKVPGFKEEKQLAAIQYSANIATTLYTVANAFKLTLSPKDKALSDALEWMRFACQIYQHPAILKLKSELEATR